MTAPDGSQVSMAALVDALWGALIERRDEQGIRRMVVPVEAGELLLMPAAGGRFVGTKIVSVAHGNPALGLPRIQGVYVLMDAATLTPVWQTDASWLTLLRTTAVSMLGVRELLVARGAPVERAVIIGSGPQAAQHVQAIVELGLAGEVLVVGRNATAMEAFADRCQALYPTIVVRAASVADVAGADLVVCCTSARTPLFDADLVDDSAIVVAIGSHRPDERELPTGLMSRAFLCLDGASGLETAGDLVLATSELGRPLTSCTLGEVVRGATAVRAHGPWVFKSVGESWQDLAVAAALAPL